jgi:hypothetical protein
MWLFCQKFKIWRNKPVWQISIICRQNFRQNTDVLLPVQGYQMRLWKKSPRMKPNPFFVKIYA